MLVSRFLVILIWTGWQHQKEESIDRDLHVHGPELNSDIPQPWRCLDWRLRFAQKLLTLDSRVVRRESHACTSRRCKSQGGKMLDCAFELSYDLVHISVKGETMIDSTFEHITLWEPFGWKHLAIYRASTITYPAVWNDLSRKLNMETILLFETSVLIWKSRVHQPALNHNLFVRMKLSRISTTSILHWSLKLERYRERVGPSEYWNFWTKCSVWNSCLAENGRRH